MVLCWPCLPCRCVWGSVCQWPAHSWKPSMCLPSPRPGSHAHPPPQAHTDSLNTLVALHQLYQYTQKYYDEVRAILPGVAAPGPWVPAAI